MILKVVVICVVCIICCPVFPCHVDIFSNWYGISFNNLYVKHQYKLKYKSVQLGNTLDFILRYNYSLPPQRQVIWLSEGVCGEK